MSYTRIFVSVAIAAAVSMLGAVGTASATELFKGKETLGKATTVQASLTGSTTLESTDGTLVDTCTGGALKGAISNAGGELTAVALEVTELTWSGCSFTADTLANGSLSINWTSGSNATVSGSAMQWTVEYAADCRYGTGSSTSLGTLTGTADTGKHATIDIDAVLNEQEPKSPFCPDTTRWKASYMVTGPTGFNAGEGAPETELFAGHETLEAGEEIHASLAPGTTTLLQSTSGALTDTCTESTIAGKTSQTAGELVAWNIEALTWGDCDFTTHTDDPGTVTIRGIGEGDGTIEGSGTTWTVTVGGTLCQYGTGAGTHLGDLDGTTSGHATIEINAIINEQGTKKFPCPDTTTMSAKYIVTSPTGLNLGGEEGTELFAGHETLEAGTLIDASLEAGSTALLQSTSEVLTDTCTESTAVGETSSTENKRITWALGALTWGDCDFTTHTDSKGSLTIEDIGEGDGTIEGSGTAWTVTIGSTLCLYGTGAGTHLGELDGATSGHARIEIDAVINEQGAKKFLCPDTTRKTAAYIVTSPTGLNVG